MHVVVTGASSGIGTALAREFGTSEGDRVTLVARRQAAMEEVARGIPAKCHIVAHDLSDDTRATAWIESAERENGPIDVLINNAGVENTGWTLEADPAASVALLRTNLVSPLLIARAIVPAMIARGTGTLVNVASVAAYSAVPLQAWYGASKAGLATFSEVLRSEVRRRGVNVVTVYPGPITTPMAEAAYVVFGGRRGLVGLAPEGTPEKLARLVRRAVERRRARVVYPSFYQIPRFVPWLARWATDLVEPRPRPRLER